MTGLAVTVRTCQALLVTGAVALSLATAQASGIPDAGAAPADPTPTPSATPQGEIAEPITGRNRHPHRHHGRRHGWLAPAISGRGAPPPEPRLTMPPTDTDR